ncbi:MAG TPA: gamma-glutamyltransferase [Polyangiaceae bacterium]|nr:gamma-glutamyltransferase [Polyangiaceae bacterium]
MLRNIEIDPRPARRALTWFALGTALFILLPAAACQQKKAAPNSAPRVEALLASVSTEAAVPLLAADSAHEPAVVPPSWAHAADTVATASRRHVVVSDSRLATRVGAAVLEAGGNAVDGAVATAFALAAAYPEAGNLGGGGFAVVESSDGSVTALDFRETAPHRARRDMFLEGNGAPRRLPARDANASGPLASQAGALAAGVPGTVAGLWALHQRFGSKPWAELIAPAIELAEQGFAVDAEFVRSEREALPRLSRFAASRELFLDDGEPLPLGATFRDPDLARVLHRIAKQGPRGFYSGETAGAIAEEMRASGGLIDLDDLRGYVPRWRTPIEVVYRGYRMVSMPPPSSGGVTLALIARLLEGYPLASLGWHSPTHLHLLAEAMSRAFADRNTLLGDPDVVNLPLTRLLSPAYAAERRQSIGERATPATSLGSGLPPPEGTHTTHFAVVDGRGSAVSLTTTINDLYGSGLTVRGAGFLLNDEMDDFTIKPGTPNSFGLTQGESNAIAPGKRMLSSLAPTLVFDPNGQLRIVAGARGGPRIISATWQVISNVIDFGMSVEQAVSAPRVHHQWLPDELLIEEGGVPLETRNALEALGHHLRAVPEIGNAPAILRDSASGSFSGVADPRRGGAVGG